MALLLEHKPYDEILAKHVAIIRADGSEDTDSEMAQGWVGILERYLFHSKNGQTEVIVEIQTPPQWEGMFEEGWPAALAKLKEICEQAEK